MNPGPKESSAIKFFILSLELKGLGAFRFVKVPLIEAFITAHSFDFVCLFETVLHSSMPRNDENSNINGS